MTKEDRALAFEIRRVICEAGLSVPALAKMLGMGRSTLFDRLASPGTFRMEELRLIKRVANRRDVPFEVKI